MHAFGDDDDEWIPTAPSLEKIVAAGWIGLPIAVWIGAALLSYQFYDRYIVGTNTAQPTLRVVEPPAAGAEAECCCWGGGKRENEPRIAELPVVRRQQPRRVPEARYNLYRHTYPEWGMKW